PASAIRARRLGQQRRRAHGWDGTRRREHPGWASVGPPPGDPRWQLHPALARQYERVLWRGERSARPVAGGEAQGWRRRGRRRGRKRAAPRRQSPRQGHGLHVRALVDTKTITGVGWPRRGLGLSPLVRAGSGVGVLVVLSPGLRLGSRAARSADPRRQWRGT